MDGKHYGTPYQWGPNVLMYNTNVFKTAPDSWSVVFEEQKLPDGKSNKGRVQAYDGPIYIADAALYLKTKQPELGIKDPYQLNETQYKAALDLLRKQQPLIHRYWHDTTVQMSDFKNEGVVASSAWRYQVNGLMAEKQPVASVIPKEGATGWADTTMLHAEAKHPNCAYKWMDWSLQPKVQGDLAAWFGSLPAVPAACKEQRIARRRRLQDQRFRPVRQDRLLENPAGRRRQVRAVQPLDPGLHRDHGRSLSPLREQVGSPHRAADRDLLATAALDSGSWSPHHDACSPVHQRFPSIRRSQSR